MGVLCVWLFLAQYHICETHPSRGWHLFLLLGRVPWCADTAVYLFHCCWTFGCSQFVSFVASAAVNILIRLV